MSTRPLRVEWVELERFCRDRFPDHHFTVTVDRTTRCFTVHRRPSPELDEAVRDRFPDREVRFADARHSSAELAAVRQTITDLKPAWSARGVVFNGLTTAADGSAVIVHVGGTEAALADFEAVLRPLPVQLLRSGAVLL